MKKVLKILFRIFYITLFSAILLALIYAFLPKLWGTAAITVAGETYLPETVAASYELGETIKVNYSAGSETVKFHHVKGNYGMYDYVIPIQGENIETELTVHYLKTNQWRINNLDISAALEETDGVWNADVTVEVDGRIFEETFYDISESGMEIRVE